MTLCPIIPKLRREPFDDPGWTFELKYDGFRALADTVNGRMISKRGHRMSRFEALLATLPPGCVLDGEIAVLDDTGRPRFLDLMFRRQTPVYVAFDLLMADGEDLRPLSLSARKAALAKIARDARAWIAVVDGVPGQGRRLFDLIVAQDLEGIVAKRLYDPYGPDVTWWKIMNRVTGLQHCTSNCGGQPGGDLLGGASDERSA